MSEITVHHGDSRDVLKTLADASIDSIVTDPPYALVSIGKRFGKEGAAPAKAGKTGAYQRASAGFMGKTWDTGETAFAVEFWAEVLRVLKPGGHVVAFSGTRTYHRMVCAIEDAGFEIRDQLAWLYGSGFPKSHDVSKGIDKAAGAQREVISAGATLKRLIPGAGQAKAGWDKTDGREFVPTVTKPSTAVAAEWEGWGTALKPALEPIVLARKPLDGTVAANVLAHGTGALNVEGCRVEASGRPARTNAESASGLTGKGGAVTYGEFAVRGSKAVGTTDQGRWPANVLHDGSGDVVTAFPTSSSGGYPPEGGMRSQVSTYGEPNARAEQRFTGSEGSAARFFYSAKADAEDRLGSKHPTVKPVDLMAWLCRLVTPPGGTILDPFAGTGTTGLAAMREGFDCILIEREAEYVADIHRRLAWARGEGRLTAQETARRPDKTHDDLPLFGGEAA